MNWLELAAFVVLGVVTGILSGLMGVGGGLLMVPVLVLVARFDQHAAQGTSLLAIIPTALAATYRHHRNRFVRFADALFLTVGGIAGAFVGSVGALNLEGSVLRRVFALALAATGARLMLAARRGSGADDGAPAGGLPVGGDGVVP